MGPEAEEGVKAHGRQSEDLLWPLAQEHFGHIQLQLKRESQDQGQIQAWPGPIRQHHLLQSVWDRDRSEGGEKEPHLLLWPHLLTAFILPLSHTSYLLAIPSSQIQPQFSRLDLP